MTVALFLCSKGREMLRDGVSRIEDGLWLIGRGSCSVINSTNNHGTPAWCSAQVTKMVLFLWGSHTNWGDGQFGSMEEGHLP